MPKPQLTPHVASEKPWLLIKNEMAACAARFQLTEDGIWHMGIAVLRDAGASDVAHFIGMDLRIVNEVWNYKLMQHEGCFTLIEAGEA